jgi:hypothetical protein
MKRLIAFFAAFTFAFSTPAFAHELTIYQGKDRGWVGENHHAVKVTDKECDSHSVWLLWHEKLTLGVFSQKDTNGCKPGGTYELAHHNRPVTSMQLCEYADEVNTWHCTNWHNV